MSEAPQIVETQQPGPATVKAICRELGMSFDWVQSRLGQAGFEPLTNSKGWQGKTYSVAAQRWLKRQKAALMRIPEIGTYLSIPQAAAELGTTRAWVYNRLSDPANNLPPVARRRNRFNRVVDCISPTTLERLKKLRPQIAPEGILSVPDMARLSARKAKTVRHRVRGMLGIEPVPYMAQDHKAHDHYPAAEVLPSLRQVYRPGGDWMTAHRMALRLGRTYDWVANRVKQPQHQRLRQMRLDDNSRPRWHYPLSVYRQLERESAITDQRSSKGGR